MLASFKKKVDITFYLVGCNNWSHFLKEKLFHSGIILPIFYIFETIQISNYKYNRGRKKCQTGSQEKRI